MVWNWKSHEGSLHGAFLDGKIKSKTGERITSNKDRIKATLKSGFYLRGCWTLKWGRMKHNGYSVTQEGNTGHGTHPGQRDSMRLCHATAERKSFSRGMVQQSFYIVNY